MGLAKTYRRGIDAAYAHYKLDGICLEVQRNRHGVISIYTTTPTDITSQLDDCGWIKSVYDRMPCSTSVMGELWVPGKPASYVKSALAHRPEELRFSAFSIPKGLGSEAELWEVNEVLTSWGFCTVDYLVNERCEDRHKLMGRGYFDDPLELLKRNLPTDIEGYVLKNSNMSDWWKLKPVKTIDLIVTDLQDGRGKYLGMVGALHVATKEGYELARVSGMSDEIREEITEDDIGRIVEVRYQYVGSQGRLRHPAFIRWRDDKTADGCGVDQDPELEEIWNGRMD